MSLNANQALAIGAIIVNRLIKINFIVKMETISLHLTRFSNSCDNHWVLLTNYDCDIDVWHFYDSLNGGQYLKSMELILGHFGPIFPGTEFQIMYNRDVQRQNGIDDCGLFV